MCILVILVFYLQNLLSDMYICRKRSYLVDPVKAMHGVDTYLMRKEPKVEIDFEDGRS